MPIIPEMSIIPNNQLCQRCEPHELLSLAKCVPQKRCTETVKRIRKETEKFGRGLRGILVKKGCEEGGLSLERAYRKLIRILDDWYRKGI